MEHNYNNNKIYLELVLLHRSSNNLISLAVKYSQVEDYSVESVKDLVNNHHRVVTQEKRIMERTEFDCEIS